MFDPEAFDEDEVGLLFNEVGTNGRVHGHCCRHSQRAAILGPATAAADTLNVLQSNRRCGEGREGARRLRSLPRPVGGHGPVRVARQGRGRRAVPEAREKGACTPPPIWQAFQSDSGEGVAQRLKRRCIGIGSSPNEAGQRLCSRPLLQLTRHELDHAMANMDEDGSGAVSEIEFGTFWRAYAVKHQYDPSHRTASSPCLCVCV